MHKEENTPTSNRSKIVVVIMLLTIIVGSLSWNAWDYFGTEGLNPKKVKAMANEYEQECYKLANDIKLCKRHMGLRHRECLKQGIKRDTPKSAPQYSQEDYNTCMRTHRDEDLKNLKR